MKKVFNLVVKEWEWIKENPVAKVSMEEENHKRDRWLTEQDSEVVGLQDAFHDPEVFTPLSRELEGCSGGFG